MGEGAGEGYSVNVPWPMGGMGNGDYMAAFNHVIMPIAYEYQPDLIIISAGFDASIGDPIGGWGCCLCSRSSCTQSLYLAAISLLQKTGLALQGRAPCRLSEDRGGVLAVGWQWHGVQTT